MISIYQARKILGSDAKKLSNSQLEELLRNCIALAELFIDIHEEEKTRKGVNNGQIQCRPKASGRTYPAYSSPGKGCRGQMEKQGRKALANLLGKKKPPAI